MTKVAQTEREVLVRRVQLGRQSRRISVGTEKLYHRVGIDLLAGRALAAVFQHQRALFSGDEFHGRGFRLSLFIPWGAAPPPARFEAAVLFYTEAQRMERAGRGLMPSAWRKRAFARG